MNVACPECTHVYRLDPTRLGDEEVLTRCRECGESFIVSRQTGAEAAGAVIDGRRAATASGQGTGQAAGTGGQPEDVTASPAETPPAPPAFGPQDPQTRARRLARALVSDIKVYNQKRWGESRARGTLRQDFRDEILKSWDEYVQQVGEGMAKGTPYFRDALNDILGLGQRVF